MNSITGEQKRDFSKLDSKFIPLTPFLHIESPYFNPTAFLEAFYQQNKNADFFLNSRKKIRNYLRDFDNEEKVILSKNGFKILEVF